MTLSIGRFNAHGVRRRDRATGFTLVEASVSVLIVGVMLVAALQTVSHSRLVQYRLAERARGEHLARALLAEIVQQRYADPDVAPVFGPELGESRATYDDVDDYNGLNDTLLTARDGVALAVPRANTWRRAVVITWMNPATLAPASPHLESGAKRVTVSTYHNGVRVAECVAVRTDTP